MLGLLRCHSNIMSFSSLRASFALSTVTNDGCCIAKLFSMWPLFDGSDTEVNSIDILDSDTSFDTGVDKRDASRFDVFNNVSTSIGIITSFPMLLSLWKRIWPNNSETKNMFIFQEILVKVFNSKTITFYILVGNSIWKNYLCALPLLPLPLLLVVKIFWPPSQLEQMESERRRCSWKLLSLLLLHRIESFSC